MDNNIETEEWRDIEGYEGLYQVSNLGRVRSLDKLVRFGSGSVKFMKGRILKPGKRKDGYLQVNLCKDGKHTTFKLQTLVAKTFQDICGEYKDGLEIDHRNCVRDDNRATNLRLVTRKENQNNHLTIQHFSNAKKGENAPWYGKFGKDNPKSKPIIQYSLNGKKLAEFDSLSDASNQLNINQGNICHVLKGRYKHTHGYIFRYKTT